MHSKNDNHFSDLIFKHEMLTLLTRHQDMKFFYGPDSHIISVMQFTDEHLSFNKV